MKTMLQKLRKKAGYKSAAEYAEHLGMSVRTYTNYEQGVRMFSLAQAWEFADDLGCSIDDLVGRETKNNDKEDPYEQELVQCYRGSNTDVKSNILGNARGQYALSKNDAECDLDEAESA